MSNSLGQVVALLRYPVKSMMGEELNAADVTERGLVGDRACALFDVETGKIVSAKNPKRWPTLFAFRSAFVAPPETAGTLPPIRITLPGGETVASDNPSVDARLTAEVGRPVRLTRPPPRRTFAEGYWPDHDWLEFRGKYFNFPMPAGTLFDGAMVHLVTTATLDRLRTLAPTSRFEISRFRPNIVIETAGESAEFPENEWAGQTLELGGVQLKIDGPCPRCVMTTLPQDSLPRDPNVLKTIVQKNAGNVGVYATVVRGGRVRRGDGVSSTA